MMVYPLTASERRIVRWSAAAIVAVAFALLAVLGTVSLAVS
ncbi:MAG TPA: hypothetical protein VGM03_17770 [Phycisphaerae bacterium]|jgi:hypothetical protein